MISKLVETLIAEQVPLDDPKREFIVHSLCRLFNEYEKKYFDGKERGEIILRYPAISGRVTPDPVKLNRYDHRYNEWHIC